MTPFSSPGQAPDKAAAHGTPSERDILTPCVHADDGDKKPPSPWLYVVTLYFPLGLMDAGLRLTLPNNLFKLTGYSNQQIGLIGGLGLIASMRFVFAPWLDGATTKRRLSIATLTLAGALAYGEAIAAFACPDPRLFFWLMFGLLLCLSVVGASHETASDGYYIRALDPKSQAQFIGIKTASIRIGILAASSGLLLLATKIAESHGSVDIGSHDKAGFRLGFSLAFALAGIVMFAIAIYNKLAIPRIPQDTPVHHGHFALKEVLRDYFRQEKIALMVGFILVYRIGEGLLAMKYPFYLDTRAAGGLGCAAADLAWISILAEMPWMMLGGVLGGYMIKWLGLRRVFIPFAFLINIPHLLYFWLAATQPATTVALLGQHLNVALLASSGIEAFCYGMSFSAMFYYLHIMATESGRNKTSVLAISLALMGLGWVMPGMISGFVQASLGYTGLFLLSSVVGLVVLFIVPKLPMPAAEKALSRGEQA